MIFSMTANVGLMNKMYSDFPGTPSSNNYFLGRITGLK